MSGTAPARTADGTFIQPVTVIGGAAGSGTSVPVSFGGTAWTDRSIANLSGASQQLAAANANRKILLVQCVGASPVGVNLGGGTAAMGVAGTITLQPGGSILIDAAAPLGAITVIGTLNDDLTAYEG
jgi:hypothetical protein